MGAVATGGIGTRAANRNYPFVEGQEAGTTITHDRDLVLRAEEQTFVTDKEKILLE